LRASIKLAAWINRAAARHAAAAVDPLAMRWAAPQHIGDAIPGLAPQMLSRAAACRCCVLINFGILFGPLLVLRAQA